MAQKRPLKIVSDSDEETAVETVKRHRNRPDLANYCSGNAEPGENAKFIAFARTLRSMEKVNFHDPKAVSTRIDEYFALCQENDIRPSIVGLASALRISRSQLWNYKTGNSGIRLPEETLDTIKEAYDTAEALWEMYVMNCKNNPANLIFLGKNFYGYKDTQDVVIQPKDPHENGTPEEIARKYVQGAVADVPDPVNGDGTVE